MSATSQKPDFIIIGRITKPHGVKGALKVEPITDDPQRFKLLEHVHIGPEDSPGDAVKIEKIQFQNKNIILSLVGFNSREQADRLRNQYLYLPTDELLSLPEGSIYIFDLLGFEVYTDKNEFVGIVKDYQEFPASHMFIVEKDEREYLIPDVPDIVIEVDTSAGKIVIHPIEGLLDE